MVLRFRYSMWDGTQEVPPLEADEVLDNLTDDLMNFGDLQHALRNLMQRGMRSPMGDRTQGLRDLLQQLRQQRREQLDKFNLNSIFDDLKKKLEEIVNMENTTLDRRLDEVSGEKPRDGGQPEGQQQPGEQGQQQPGQRSQGRQPEGGEQGAEQQRGSEQAGGQQPGETPSEFADMLRNIANKKKDFLGALPEDVAGQVKQLQNYEFMDPGAQEKFNELLESLKKAMTETFFKDMYEQIANMGPEELERMKNMVSDLNQMLQDKMQGREPDFDGFMDKYGEFFGDNPPKSLDELIAQMQHQMGQMQSLMDSLPGEMRQQLSDLLSEKVGDAGLQQGLNELGQNLEYLFPMRELRNQYPFRGEESIDLESAMGLMDQMQSIDELERQLERTQYLSLIHI